MGDKKMWAKAFHIEEKTYICNEHLFRLHLGKSKQKFVFSLGLHYLCKQ